jgi:hypothetical protein
MKISKLARSDLIFCSITILESKIKEKLLDKAFGVKELICEELLGVRLFFKINGMLFKLKLVIK